MRVWFTFQGGRGTRFDWWLACLVIASWTPGSSSAAVVLNEVMVSNSGVILDEDGDSSDWIELRNTGAESINLEGYGFSDRAALSNRWVFDSYFLSPQKPLVVFASGKDRQVKTEQEATSPIADLTRGLSLWLVADDLAGEGDRGEVAAWRNRADPELALIRGVDQPGPQWVGGELNGRAVVRFGEGGGQRLDAAGVPAGALGGQSALTLVVVQRTAPPRHNGSALFYETSSGRRINLHSLWSDGVLYFDFGRVDENGRMAMAPPGGFLGQWRLVTLIRDPSGRGRVFVNGALVSEGTMLSDLVPEEVGNLAVGAFEFQGDLAEIVMAPSAYTVEERLRMEAYLASKYALPYRGRVFHTDFKLKSGEAVILTNASGETIDRLTTTGLLTDQSFGRSKDLNEQGYSDRPTPGTVGGGELTRASPTAPLLSHESGIYPGPITLQWEHDDPTVVLRYTLDGSDPTSDSPIMPSRTLIDARGATSLSRIPTNPSMHRDDVGTLSMPDDRRAAFGWLSPESVSPSAKVLKARAFREGALPGKIVTRTFFIGNSFLEAPSVPVVAITLEPEQWFGVDDGLYLPGRRYDPDSWRHRFWGTGNYFIKGRHSERPVWLEVFESGAAVLSGGVGLRIHGGGSRAQPQKALRLTARKSLGLESLSMGTGQGGEDGAYRQLTLRNSGQDSVWHPTLLRDSVIQASAPSTVIGQTMRPVIVYLNGEYWGVHQWQEHFNEVGLRRRFGLDREEIDLIEVNGKPRSGDAEAYHRLMALANSEASGAVESIFERIDIESFVDHYITQIYFANTDWPGNNVAYWRARIAPDGARAVSPSDGRWRWLTFGTEAGLGLGGDVSHRSVERLLDVAKADASAAPWSTALFRRLMTHTPFRFHFLTRFASLLNHEFSQSRVLDLIDVRVEAMVDLMAAHAKRWGRPQSVAHWLEELVRIRKFVIERPEIQRKQLKEWFGFSGNADVEFEIRPVGAGQIVFNGLNQAGNPISWAARSGIYFEGIPMALKAVANPGYRFVGWDGAIKSEATVRFHIPVDGQRIVAEFVDVVPVRNLKFEFEPGVATLSVVLDRSLSPEHIRWERSDDLKSWIPLNPVSPVIEPLGEGTVRYQVAVSISELKKETQFFRAVVDPTDSIRP